MQAHDNSLFDCQIGTYYTEDFNLQVLLLELDGDDVILGKTMALQHQLENIYLNPAILRLHDKEGLHSFIQASKPPYGGASTCVICEKERWQFPYVH